jgi:hypothetical protein
MHFISFEEPGKISGLFFIYLSYMKKFSIILALSFLLGIFSTNVASEQVRKEKHPPGEFVSKIKSEVQSYVFIVNHDSTIIPVTADCYTVAMIKHVEVKKETSLNCFAGSEHRIRSSNKSFTLLFITKNVYTKSQIASARLNRKLYIDNLNIRFC